ncbi:Uncharacterised protein [uncultured Roseburia sp.]|uniref:Uncharacterized protein n=1 Tax=Brotonthovivens ammoniilytica TaxID=2981725 RepID=A0ABT2TPB5_9FIRM|nr:DUF6553 family protein [Brotonthovivens ammoniilytica]MCU6763616.1 hypothetical protein [Brotonthovivens ammoniilytica]SCJ27078.1 Uncharacterised protein [uncultured Roseburia sp.]
MLLKKAEVKKEEVNPYDWPESYYMEVDAGRRLALLKEHKKSRETEEIDSLRMELWEMRYQPLKKENEFKDTFMGGLIHLLMLTIDAARPFSKKRACKEAQKILQQLGLDFKEHFTRELLETEIKHLFLVYAATCLEDKQYGSLLFGFGRIKKDKVEKKIAEDIRKIGFDLPKLLDMQTEFSIVAAGGRAALRHMGMENDW